MPAPARSRRAWIAASVALLTAIAPSPGLSAREDLTALGWRWPVDTVRIVAPYHAPAHAYGPGHRGIDLAVGGDAVRAPADGTVAFSGSVAGRGVLTIDHGDGLVTTLEPIDAGVAVGTAVTRGDTVAEPAVGGHASPGSLHFGVRLHGEYLNPQSLIGGVPRAVLLPCC